MIDLQSNPRVSRTGTPMLEVVDYRNRPLLVLEADEVHRQNLCHRRVQILVHDQRRRLLLQKRSSHRKTHAHFWDTSANGHVLAGEAHEESALSCLYHQLGLFRDELFFRHEIPANAQTSNEFITLYSVTIEPSELKPNPTEIEELCFLDQDEMTTMLNDFAELLTPNLHYFNQKGLLFQAPYLSSPSKSYKKSGSMLA